MTMRSNVNILNDTNKFTYLIEYTKQPNNICTWDVEYDNSLEYHENHNIISGNNVYWSKTDNTVHLLKHDIYNYRKVNEWHSVSGLQQSKTNIPNTIKTANIKVYIPTYSVSDYINGIKYVISANTWINGVKVDLGSMIFNPNDTYAISTGLIKNGDNEYYECVDFDIIDPMSLTYSDDWINFRHLVCGEPTNINSTGSLLNVSLHIVDKDPVNGLYMCNSNCVGGYTNFNIVDDNDYLTLKLSENLLPLGIRFDTYMNSEYDWLLTYLEETYNITTTHNGIKYELIIKNKDTAILGGKFNYSASESTGQTSQVIEWSSLAEDSGLKVFFSDWNAFEEGWNIVGSLIVFNSDEEEILSIVSNELPITQYLFSIFTNGGAEKIIDIQDMNITQYNVVNKIENKIIQMERPNVSKSNIIQPVFFRVKDTEFLTIHPIVTENISINLDEYKSKVKKFVLQIDGHKFDQIGVNSYGVLFKIPANVISTKTLSGTYYVLNENYELVTTGKYNCVL